MFVRSLTSVLVAFSLVGVLNAQEMLDSTLADGTRIELASWLSGDESAGCSSCREPGCGGEICSACYGRSGARRPFTVGGWLDAGFVLNGNRSASGFHGPYNQTDRHEAALNQAYITIERALADCPEWGLGGRVDMMYGTDFFLGQSIGMEKALDGSSRWNGDHYGFAIPQAYGEIGNDRLSFKLGHFYTIVGYEGVPAVNNFFYTKSLSYMFAGPFVQWGGLASWKANQKLSFDAGIVNGWDALDRETDAPAFLGRVSWGSDQDLVWGSFALITGDELDNGGIDTSNRTRYSMIAGANLTSRLQYVFHHWYGVQNDFLAAGDSARWYGIDQYLYYDLAPCLRLGGRFEWFRDDDGVRLGLSRPSNPNNNPFVGDMYSLSVGLNWTPCENLMIRPEVRCDWFDGTGAPFDDGTDDQQLLLGMDMIWKF